MHTVIISGSNRAESGSRKVADYIGQTLEEQDVSYQVYDLNELDLPLWSEALWESDSPQAQTWVPIKQTLEASQALVLVAPEWNGTIPPALQNFLMHLGREVAHKPVLLVGVSAGLGGTYPIAQLKAFGNKNNRMLFVPDHLIVRQVEKDLDSSDHPIGPRVKESVRALIVYAKHMEQLRLELDFDYQTFSNGM